MRLLLAPLLLFPTLVPGAVPSGFSDTLVAGNISSPTAMAFAPDGRIFVCQQNGALRVIKNETLLPTPFLTLSVDSAGERGLLGIAFDPNFATNQYVYLYYTLPTTVSPRRNRVSRFTASGDVAAAGSETVLLELDNLSSATNHNGGALHFGLDGKLYIAVGDNAAGSNSQTLANLHGKVLRMNPDGSIPADNPFFSAASGKNRLIWALGLRNPFTFAVQPGTGRIFVNDVGQSAWEEINDAAAGDNFGWPATEGDFNQASFPNFKRPLYAYANDASTCAITGGTFYNPATMNFPPSYAGKYFFADFCANWIRVLDFSGAAPLVSGFLTGGSSIVDLKVGPEGALYYLQRGNGGEVRRIRNTAAAPPSITTHPANQTVAAGQSATFSVNATGSDLAYQWQRNNVNIPGATGAAYTLSNAQPGDSGALFRVIVTNPGGAATSDAALLTVVANQPPAASITSPAAGVLFSAGDTVFFSGSASDPETGPLPLANYRWKVDYITGAARRSFVQEFSGAAGGSFAVPTVTPYLLTDVYFEIIFTATDPHGFSTTVTRRIDPRVSTVTLASTPPGRQLTLDGQPVTAPLTFDSVVNLTRPLGAPSPQPAGASRYVFTSWSDGGAQNHDISVPLANTTYTANFRLEHPLTTAANPPGGGTISPGGFFAAGSVAAVAATPAPGWRFFRFSGDSTSSTSPLNLTMDGPKSLTAQFLPLPPLLTLDVTARQEGPGAGQRTWTVRITNTGQGPALNLRILGLGFYRIGSAVVTALSPMPLNFGDVPPGARAPPTVVLDYPVTDPPTRVTILARWAADYGYTGTLVTFNQDR
jgi:glucose/arabinose dehydrogenase